MNKYFLRVLILFYVAQGKEQQKKGENKGERNLNQSHLRVYRCKAQIQRPLT